VNNWKLAVRLNSEILSQQHKMKEMLRSNRYLIPEVSTQQKTDAFVLVKEYASDARKFLAERVSADMDGEAADALLKELEVSSPVAQAVNSDPELAISTHVGCRVLKLAALLDNENLLKILETEMLPPLNESGVPRLIEWGKQMLNHFEQLVK
jgi:hypothetical protein